MITSNKEKRVGPNFFLGSARSRRSAKVKYFFECCSETCDQIRGKSHSLFFERWPAPTSSSTMMIFLVGAPIIVQFRCDVKSFL